MYLGTKNSLPIIAKVYHFSNVVITNYCNIHIYVYILYIYIYITVIIYIYYYTSLKKVLMNGNTDKCHL